jgi:hypothetical protein
MSAASTKGTSGDVRSFGVMLAQAEKSSFHDDFWQKAGLRSKDVEGVNPHAPYRSSCSQKIHQLWLISFDHNKIICCLFQLSNDFDRLSPPVDGPSRVPDPLSEARAVVGY